MNQNLFSYTHKVQNEIDERSERVFLEAYPGSVPALSDEHWISALTDLLDEKDPCTIIVEMPGLKIGDRNVVCEDYLTVSDAKQKHTNAEVK